MSYFLEVRITLREAAKAVVLWAYLARTYRYKFCRSSNLEIWSVTPAVA